MRRFDCMIILLVVGASTFLFTGRDGTAQKRIAPPDRVYGYQVESATERAGYHACYETALGMGTATGASGITDSQDNVTAKTFAQATNGLPPF